MKPDLAALLARVEGLRHLLAHERAALKAIVAEAWEAGRATRPPEADASIRIEPSEAESSRSLWLRWMAGEDALDILGDRYFAPARAVLAAGNLDEAHALGCLAEGRFRADIGEGSVLWIRLDAEIQRIRMLARLRASKT